ncbi:MAG: hypothetical protein IMF08_09360 [Proteobacteria bacterium]|nr:hypothetical protein [Pseudomonadota bacterium]
MHDMVGKTFVLGIFAAALAATPVLAQEAEEPGRVRETCAEVSLDGDLEFNIPCPPGIRPLLEHLPRPTDPPPRRDIVIDPEWPHDQAVVAEDDWSHDWAMVVPRADEGEEEFPLFGDLLGLFEPLLSGHLEEDGGWRVLQSGEELDETAE